MTPDKLNKYRKGNFELKSKHIYAKKKLENIRDYILLSHNLVGGTNSVLIDYGNATKEIENQIDNNDAIINNFTPIENTIKQYLGTHMNDKYVTQLINADKELTNIFYNFHNLRSDSEINKKFKTNLINIQKNLFKLQVKIIFSNLKKIEGEDINPLLEIINKKIETMNNYIENQDELNNEQKTPNPIEKEAETEKEEVYKSEAAQIKADEKVKTAKALKEEVDRIEKEKTDQLAQEDADRQKAAQEAANNKTIGIFSVGMKNVEQKAKEAEQEEADRQKAAQLKAAQLKAEQEEADRQKAAQAKEEADRKKAEQEEADRQKEAQTLLNKKAAEEVANQIVNNKNTGIFSVGMKNVERKAKVAEQEEADRQKAAQLKAAQLKAEQEEAEQLKAAQLKAEQEEADRQKAATRKAEEEKAEENIYNDGYFKSKEDIKNYNRLINEQIEPILKNTYGAKTMIEALEIDKDISDEIRKILHTFNIKDNIQKVSELPGILSNNRIRINNLLKRKRVYQK
jgi:hypothetical protein